MIESQLQTISEKLNELSIPLPLEIIKHILKQLDLKTLYYIYI